MVPYALEELVGPGGDIPQQFPEVNRYVFHHFATENKIYLICTITISYHNHFVPLPFRTICRSIHYYHFVPYADRHIMTISYHMQIDTL
jgi:hypothetical protein